MAYTIIEVEKKTGVSSHTLRFWAKKVCFHLWRKTIIKSSILVSVMWSGCVGSIGFGKSQMDIPMIKHYINLANKGDFIVQERRDIIARKRNSR